MAQDWLEKLQSLRDELPGGETEAETDKISDEAESPSDNSARLDIILEKKGRAGKQATIITGWNGSDEGLETLASTLKKRLATGGSTRGGEILIQGDRRQAVEKELKAQGYKCRII
ncbi:MAG: translation initiation factor [Paramuribaculum sp.]|nr:translation initiation factor [Paramuribaculum sp.]